jgi:hypothetical protein
MHTNDEDVEEVVTLYLHLLRFALDDMTVANPKQVCHIFSLPYLNTKWTYWLDRSVGMLATQVQSSAGTASVLFDV